MRWLFLGLALLASARLDAATRPTHAELAGRYRFADGCELVMTPSRQRLWVRNTCTHEWRAFARRGSEWVAGQKTVVEGTVPWRQQTTLRFTMDAAHVTIAATHGVPLTAVRNPTYSLAETQFMSGALPLAGHIYRPSQSDGHSKVRRATVMIHGSGPQDRYGYASIIAVLADALAADGHTVLAYDKRGSGESGGDGEHASFADLARDAIAAQQHLAREVGIAASDIGFAGSSQAGWVIAKAIEQGATPQHVLLLGAAGAAMNVPEQNTYNTHTRLRCDGYSETDIAAVTSQHRAFYNHMKLRRSDSALRLQELTKAIPWRARSWAMPSEIDFSKPRREWYSVLELDFDPLPIWQDYRGQSVFIFAEHDDSTPTAVAVNRLRAISRPNMRLRTLPKAQHLGLAAASVCHGNLTDSTRFVPQLFEWFSLRRSGEITAD